MSQSYLEKARELLEREEYQKALLTISRGLLTQPTNVEAYRIKCQCLMELGRYREVITTVDGAPDSISSDLELQTYRGEAFYFLRDFRQSYRILSDVFSRNPKNTRVQLLMEQILLEEQKRQGRKPVVVGQGDAEDLYGWKSVLDSLGLTPEDLPPEFLSKVGDEATALDLPAGDEGDPTKTIPVEVPAWLEDSASFGMDDGSDGHSPEPSFPGLKDGSLGELSDMDSHRDDSDLTPIAVSHDAVTRARTDMRRPLSGDDNLLEDDEENDLVPTRDYLLQPQDSTDDDEIPTRNYVLQPSSNVDVPVSESPTRDYLISNVPAAEQHMDTSEFESLPTQNYTPNPSSSGSGRRKQRRQTDRNDFVMQFHAIDDMDAPPQEELGEVEGEIEVQREDSFFTEEPKLPSISVDLSSIEELPPLPSIPEAPMPFQSPPAPPAPPPPPAPPSPGRPPHGSPPNFGTPVSAAPVPASSGADLIRAVIQPPAPAVPEPPPPVAQDVEIEQIVNRVAPPPQAMAPTMPISRMDRTSLVHAVSPAGRKLWLLFMLAILLIASAGVGLYFHFRAPPLPPQKKLVADIDSAEGVALKSLMSRIVEYERSYPDRRWLRRLHILSFLKAKLTGWYSPPQPKPNVGDPLVDGLMNAFSRVEEGQPAKARQELDKLDSYLDSCRLCTSLAARVHLILGDVKKASKLLESLKLKGAVTAVDACLLMNLYIQAGDYEQAEELQKYFLPMYRNSSCLEAERIHLELSRGKYSETLPQEVNELLSRPGISPRLMVRLQLLQVEVLARSGQSSDAAEKLKTIKELIPEWDLYMLTEYASTAMDLGQYREASGVLGSILRKLPAHARARALKREALFRLGKVREVMKEGRGVRHDATTAMAYLVYGDVPRAQRILGPVGESSSLMKRIAGALLQVRMGRPSRAEELLGPKPPKYSPAAPLWAWVKSEILVMRRVGCSHAVRPLREFASSALLWKRLVELECLLRERQWVKAVDMFNRAVKEFEGVDALEPLGFSVMRVMGDFKQLAPKLRDYIQSLSSAHYQWYLYLAEAHRNLRHWKEARATLDEALRHALPGERYYLEKAKLYMSRGFWRSALKYLKKLEGVSDAGIVMERDVLHAVAYGHYRHRPEDAFSMIEPYANVYNPTVFWGFAEIYCMSKDIEQAVRFYDEAIKLAQKNRQTPWELSRLLSRKAWCLYRNKKYTKAREVAAAALAITPFQYRASLLLGRYSLRTRNRSGALGYFSSVVRACPNHPEAVCRIGLLMGPEDSSGLAYLKLCASMRGAPRGLRRRARRVLRRMR